MASKQIILHVLYVIDLIWIWMDIWTLGHNYVLASHRRLFINVRFVRRCSELVKGYRGLLGCSYGHVGGKHVCGVVSSRFALAMVVNESLARYYVGVCFMILQVRHHSIDSVSYDLSVNPWLGLFACML